MPVELGSFDAIIGMDWLAKYQAIIEYAEKIIHLVPPTKKKDNHPDVANDYPEWNKRTVLLGILENFIEGVYEERQNTDQATEKKKEAKDLSHTRMLQRRVGRCVNAQRKVALSDYDCEIRYHPGKAKVCAEAIKQEGEKINQYEFRALVLTNGLELPKSNLECSN
ncbi:putative reverse transcriptase domain-containing protein [Tanacetum coccineum]